MIQRKMQKKIDKFFYRWIKASDYRFLKRTSLSLAEAHFTLSIWSTRTAFVGACSWIKMWQQPLLWIINNLALDGFCAFVANRNQLRYYVLNDYFTWTHVLHLFSSIHLSLSLSLSLSFVPRAPIALFPMYMHFTVTKYKPPRKHEKWYSISTHCPFIISIVLFVRPFYSTTVRYRDGFCLIDVVFALL